MNDASLSFSERLAKLREEKEKAAGTWTPPVNPEDVIDVRGDYETDDELDAAVNTIDIISAYKKWINKSQVNVGQRTESIMISCPLPGHADKNPSAWINTDKGTWYCAKDEEGGDKYDLAAIHYGYPRPGYKEGQTFHKLRTQMAEDFGYVVKKVAGGQVVYKEEVDEQPSPNHGPAPQTQAQPVAKSQPDIEHIPASSEPEADAVAKDAETLSHMYADMEEGELVSYPHINWRDMVPQGTFLWEYLEACTQDDSPEEYHFWHGLLALGHAAGRNVYLDDTKPVLGNLLLCLLGASGVGKSRSRGWLNTVLRAVLPFQETGQNTTGVKLVAVPGSGEFLIKEFQYESRDPTNPKVVLGYEPVNGIVDFDELAALLTRANRQGSTLKPTIMAMADARDEVHIGSLTHGGFKAERPYCSITATTQPKAVRTLLNKTDAGSGFLNRWVFAGGPPKEREVIGGTRSGFKVDLTNAIGLLKGVRGWSSKEHVIEFDDDAFDLFYKFMKTVVFPAQEKDQSDLLKRLDLLMKKLCLLFTINLKSDTVNAATVGICIDLCEYIINCFGLLEENIGVTQNQEIVDEILRHVRRHYDKTKRGASARDLMRYMHRKNYPPDQFKKALETMVSLDMIELEKKQAGMAGRPTVRYVAVRA